MSFKKLLVLTCTSLLITSAAFAKMGTESGGGGDDSEVRVDEIRSDILKWINDDGAKGLNLPNELSYGEYVSSMTDILQPKKVVIGFQEQEVSVSGTPKTCRGFIAKSDSKPHILCNISRFKNTSESGQYKLIHHEYAGLVNVENNEGSASDYAISSQLTDFLASQVVLRLAVKNLVPIKIKRLVREIGVGTVISFKKEIFLLATASSVSISENCTFMFTDFSKHDRILKPGILKVKDFGSNDVNDNVFFTMTRSNRSVFPGKIVCRVGTLIDELEKSDYIDSITTPLPEPL